jgi:hypothetical protein
MANDETLAARLLWKHVYWPALAMSAAGTLIMAAVLIGARMMIYG